MSVGVAYQLVKKPSDGVPGPPVFIPLVGESIEYFNDPAAFAWKRYKKYKSKVFWSHVFGVRTVFVGDIELAKSIMSDQSRVVSHIPAYTFQKLMGAGMAPRALPGHKVHRKHNAAGLAPMPLKHSMGAFVDIIQSHITQWLEAGRAGTPQLELLAVTRNMMVQTGVEAIQGLRFDSEQERREVLELVSVYQAGLFCAPIYLPGTTWYKALNIRKAYTAKVAELVQRRFPATRNSSSSTAAGASGAAAATLVVDPSVDTGAAPGLNMATLMLQEMQELGLELSLERVVDWTLLSLLGATETTAGVALGLLAITSVLKEVQQKLRDEQAALLSSHGPDLSWEVLATKVPYCDAVVREALRICPSAHGVFRISTREVQLGPYRLPAGTNLLLTTDLLTQVEDEQIQQALARKAQSGAAAAHNVVQGSNSTGSAQQQQQLPDHLDVNKLHASFKPERWMHPDTRPGALHVFTHGPYSCLGREVAIMELKIMLCLLARSARWGLKNRPEPVFKFLPHTRIAGGPVYLDISADPVPVKQLQVLTQQMCVDGDNDGA